MMRGAALSGLMAGGLSALTACAATDGAPAEDPARVPVYTLALQEKFEQFRDRHLE